MRRAGGGSIVNISSVAGIGQSLHQEPAYAASKGAIRIFTKVTASQHAKDRIRCNSVHPGPIDTEMLHSAIPDKDALQRRLQRVPLGRMGDRKSTRLNSSHTVISYAVFCLKKKKTTKNPPLAVARGRSLRASARPVTNAVPWALAGDRRQGVSVSTADAVLTPTAVTRVRWN